MDAFSENFQREGGGLSKTIANFPFILRLYFTVKQCQNVQTSKVEFSVFRVFTLQTKVA